jgi:hypothetical protein
MRSKAHKPAPANTANRKHCSDVPHQPQEEVQQLPSPDAALALTEEL